MEESTDLDLHCPESKLSVAITSNGMNYGNNDIVIAILSSYYNRKFETHVSSL
jgi:hypothetical protein